MRGKGDNMKVVLIKDLKGKGKKGDIIDVNAGYATNFLIPNGYAIVGNAANLNEAKQAIASKQHQAKELKDEALALQAKLKGLQVTVSIKCGENGKIFGSVTNKEIAYELEKLGYNIDRKKIEIPTIKNIGTFTAKLKLHPNVHAEIEVLVIAA